MFLYSSTLVENNSMLKSEDAPKCDLTFIFMAALKHAENESCFSRPSIIERMNEALGGEKSITKDIYSKWFSLSSPTKLPAEFLPAFCWATQSIAPFAALLAPLEHSPVDARSAAVVDASRKIMQGQKLIDEGNQVLTKIHPQSLTPPHAHNSGCELSDIQK
ncbi:hypothetical protein [Pseudoalteromonas obscura]|uniref:Uncharacterized protein n=1 Tax=Pseudoalteromonas obscura TaxID=3048491 RepID=A0ABT7EUG0_9GAMM|nr:hypothetical protein [Pseudoalteromonas sp. P94(2023)]MDK2598638.1 hypothetical protein [Pseudoalteromonas sp. P94(2023)]